MPRKNQNKSRNVRKTRKTRNRKNKSINTKSRRYRVKGGCENGTCLSPNSPPWISKGGSYLEDILNKDLYDHTTDKSFYSSAN